MLFKWFLGHLSLLKVFYFWALRNFETLNIFHHITIIQQEQKKLSYLSVCAWQTSEFLERSDKQLEVFTRALMSYSLKYNSLIIKVRMHQLFLEVMWNFFVESRHISNLYETITGFEGYFSQSIENILSGQLEATKSKRSLN